MKSDVIKFILPSLFFDHCVGKTYQWLNSSLKHKLLEKSKSREMADDKINVIEKQQFCDGNGKRKLWKKEKNAVCLFQQCFQKASSSRSIKVRIVW